MTHLWWYQPHISAMHELNSRNCEPETYAARLDDIANRTAGRYPALSAQLRQNARDHRESSPSSEASRDSSRPPG